MSRARKRDGPKILWDTPKISYGYLPGQLRLVSAKYGTADAISRIFQVSSEAAEIALFDQQQNLGKSLSSSEAVRRLALEEQTKRNYASSIEDQAAAVFYGIKQALIDAQAASSPMEALRNNPLSSAVLIAIGSRLLLDAYQSFQRSIGADGFAPEAALIAAVDYMRPIREIGEEKTCSEDVLFFNRRCAVHAVTKSLSINHTRFNCALPKSDDPTSFESSYLNELLKAGQQIVDATTILNVPDFPDYATYNADNDIGWGDIHYLESLMNALQRLMSDT
jgi:hypothetical protein